MQQIIEQKSVLMNMTNKPTNAKHIYGSVSKYIHSCSNSLPIVVTIVVAKNMEDVLKRSDPFPIHGSVTQNTQLMC